MMQDEKSNWVPEAHMFTAMKDSNIVAAELQQISLSCSTVHLLTLLLYRLNNDVISDDIFSTCSLMTSPMSNAQFKRSSLVLLLASKRCHTFSAKSTPLTPFGKSFLALHIRGVESTSLGGGATPSCGDSEVKLLCFL